jgi:UDP-2,3-diacylglucosamine hydrolase
MVKKIGIFVSNDELSEYVYKKLRVDAETFPFSFSPVGFVKSAVFHLGDIGSLLDYFKEKDINELLFIGRIPPEFVFRGVLNPSVKKILGEGNKPLQGERILSDLSFYLEREKIRVLPLTEILAEELSMGKVYTVRQPEGSEKNDIEIGTGLLKGIMQYRTGQSVAVKKGVVIAVEGIEGTDEMIRRAGRYCKDFVIVKIAGLNKDERFDIPVVGPETIKNMREARGRVIAVESGKTIIFDEETTVAICNKSGITLLGVDINERVQ